jgi:hypothetical protein
VPQQIGAAPPERFEHELAQLRHAFAAGTLGLADLVLVSIPSLETLQRQRNADPTRRRRPFDLHSQLGEHLQRWYAGVDALDPGRVIWKLSPEGLPAHVPQYAGNPYVGPCGPLLAAVGDRRSDPPSLRHGWSS